MRVGLAIDTHDREGKEVREEGLGRRVRGQRERDREREEGRNRSGIGD
jgi:hypothetical protein